MNTAHTFTAALLCTAVPLYECRYQVSGDKEKHRRMRLVCLVCRRETCAYFLKGCVPVSRDPSATFNFRFAICCVLVSCTVLVRSSTIIKRRHVFLRHAILFLFKMGMTITAVPSFEESREPLLRCCIAVYQQLVVESSSDTRHKTRSRTSLPSGYPPTRPGCSIHLTFCPFLLSVNLLLKPRGISKPRHPGSLLVCCDSLSLSAVFLFFFVLGATWLN